LNVGAVPARLVALLLEHAVDLLGVLALVVVAEWYEVLGHGLRLELAQRTAAAIRKKASTMPSRTITNWTISGPVMINRAVRTSRHIAARVVVRVFMSVYIRA
jgi:hypothetical protein